MSFQRSILLTSPEGSHTNIHKIIEPDATELNSADLRRNSSDGNAVRTNIQFDSEQIENDRGRSKKRNGLGMRNGGMVRNGVSRSRSRASSSVRDEEFLKWTVLRKDPSMRLKFKKTKMIDGDEVEEDEDDDEEDDDDEISDEEQVSDVESENDIDEEFTFDLGMKVLPNYTVATNDVLESSKKWIDQYLKTEEGQSMKDIQVEELEGGYIKAIELISKGKGSDAQSDSYILYVDLTSESMYALAYILGALVNNGDTLYIIHWEGNSKHGDKDRMIANVARLRKHAMHLTDCISAVIDDLDLVILSVTHPYPKHFLNEMIYGLKPKALCCSLSVVLSPSGLQHYVCSIPMLVIRKKLKRLRRKGINE